MGRPTTLAERNNVECPECGSRLTRSRGGGRDIDDQRIRRRVCVDCRLIFCTVETVLLYEDGSPVPFSALVQDNLIANRRNQRRRVGYHAMKSGRRPYIQPARVRVRVSVSRPVRAEHAGPWPEDWIAGQDRIPEREEERLSA